MGFKDLSTNKKLDAVLENLNDWHTKDRQPHAIKYKYRGIRDKYELITEMGIETEDVYELDLILEYLSEVEHYIVLLGGDKGAYATYRILYEGRVFIENGGYVGRATDESWTRWGGRIQTLILTIGTGLAGIGGIGILLIEIHRHYCH